MYYYIQEPGVRNGKGPESAGYNQKMPMRKFIVPLALSAVLMIAGCQANTRTPGTPTPTQLLFLTPYWTATATGTPTPPATLASVPVTPLPTATPFTYILKNDDTLLGLAFRYGVKVEDILAANPGINPHFLSVGKTVVIPIQNIKTEPAPTPTAVPAAVQSPQCYRSSTGGAWCLMLVHNDQNQALENISGWIGLYDQQGESISSQGAIPPLNILNPGDSMPLAVFFPPPLPASFEARGGLLTASTVADQDKRYLNASLKDVRLDIQPGGIQASVQGQIELSSGSLPARVIWIAAVAYGERGELAGFRKLELDLPCGPLPTATQTRSITAAPTQPASACAALPFEISVYSLGPQIQRVETLVEARP